MQISNFAHLGCKKRLFTGNQYVCFNNNKQLEFMQMKAFDNKEGDRKLLIFPAEGGEVGKTY